MLSTMTTSLSTTTNRSAPPFLAPASSVKVALLPRCHGANRDEHALGQRPAPIPRAKSEHERLNRRKPSETIEAGTH